MILSHQCPLLALLATSLQGGKYTGDYAVRLYDRVARALQKRQPNGREELLCNANLILFYIDLNDGSETHIIDKFGVEALVISLNVPSISEMPTDTENQRNRLVNILFKKIDQARQQVGDLIHIITEEVTNKANKTCLLLPSKTFGDEFRKVRDQVHLATRERLGRDEFKERLKTLASSFRKHRERYFIHRGIVFRSPGSGMRHGLAPVWGDGSHTATCVIRGRIRFGVPFDPRFHYDCQIPNRGRIKFPGCHEPKTVDRNHQHVNVAPNDNVREKK